MVVPAAPVAAVGQKRKGRAGCGVDEKRRRARTLAMVVEVGGGVEMRVVVIAIVLPGCCCFGAVVVPCYH